MMYLKTIYSILVLLFLAGCSDEKSKVIIDPVKLEAAHVLSAYPLSWVIPTENTDNSPFPQSDILNYTLYLEELGGTDKRSYVITDTLASEYAWKGYLGDHTYIFYLTVTGKSNIESAASNSITVRR